MTQKQTETIQESTQVKHLPIRSIHNLWQTQAQKIMHLKNIFQLWNPWCNQPIDMMSWRTLRLTEQCAACIEFTHGPAKPHVFTSCCSWEFTTWSMEVLETMKWVNQYCQYSLNVDYPITWPKAWCTLHTTSVHLLTEVFPTPFLRTASPSLYVSRTIH